MPSSRPLSFLSPLVLFTLLACASRRAEAPVEAPHDVEVEASEAVELLPHSISGVVCDALGSPIEGATVWAHPWGDGWVPYATTDIEGRFCVELRDAPTYDLSVEADGFARYAEQARLSTDAGSHRPGERDVRISLRRLRPTTFVVLDERTGRPVPEFQLELRWESLGRVRRFTGPIASESSGANEGAIQCYADPLEQTFRVAALGYEPKRGEIVFDPPSSNVCTIRLAPLVLTRFVVFDERTGAPITRYRLELEWKGESWALPHIGADLSPSEVESADAVERLTSPERQHVSVASLGFETHRSEIRFDEPGTNVCTVRLRPTSVLLFHVARDPWIWLGDIVVYRGSLERGAQARGIDAQEFYEDHVSGRHEYDRADAPPFPWFVQHVAYGDDDPDDFKIEGLPPGEYRIESWCTDEWGNRDGQRLVIDPIDLAENEVLDLGTVQLTRGAKLHGSVLVPDGVDPSLIELRAESWGKPPLPKPSASGAVTFDALPAWRVPL